MKLTQQIQIYRLTTFNFFVPVVEQRVSKRLQCQITGKPHLLDDFRSFVDRLSTLDNVTQVVGPAYQPLKS